MAKRRILQITAPAFPLYAVFDEQGRKSTEQVVALALVEEDVKGKPSRYVGGIVGIGCVDGLDLAEDMDNFAGYSGESIG